MIDKIELEIVKDVYDPAEDSFLIAENVIISPNNKVMEVGSGSGYVSIYLAKKYPLAEFFCVDINYFASKITKINADMNGITLCSLNCNLLNVFTTKACFFDIILFNSPYLPVKDNYLLAKAWSGGEQGLEIIKEFIVQLNFSLKRTGKCFLVVSSKTNLEQLNLFIIQNKLAWKVVDHISEGNETILLYSIERI